MVLGTQKAAFSGLAEAALWWSVALHLAFASHCCKIPSSNFVGRIAGARDRSSALSTARLKLIAQTGLRHHTMEHLGPAHAPREMLWRCAAPTRDAVSLAVQNRAQTMLSETFCTGRLRFAGRRSGSKLAAAHARGGAAVVHSGGRIPVLTSTTFAATRGQTSSRTC